MYAVQGDAASPPARATNRGPAPGLSLRHMFVSLGVPLVVRSDNGPQYASSEYKDFLKNWQVTPRYSSPHFPRSNGHAEAAVKVIKKLAVATGEDATGEAFLRGLLHLRNEPRADGVSPAQRLFGHRLRSFIPATANAFAPVWQYAAADRQRQALAERTRKRYDERAHSLRPLNIGQEVAMKHGSGKWSDLGIVVEKNLPHRTCLLYTSPSPRDS